MPRKDLEERREYKRKYREENREKIRLEFSDWAKRNPEKLKMYSRNKRKSKPHLVLMLMTVAVMMRWTKARKSNRSASYVGCSPGFLKNHIESLFQPGMTWDNYGEWHVDHIVPLSWFPFDKDPSLLYVASHWSNLQPMWARENISKGNRRVA